jgi:hypothetical protein
VGECRTGAGRLFEVAGRAGRRCVRESEKGKIRLSVFDGTHGAVGGLRSERASKQASKRAGRRPETRHEPSRSRSGSDNGSGTGE